MDIEIERLNVHLGSGMNAGRARTIGGLIEAALQATLRAHAGEISAAPSGYRIPVLAIPALRIRAGASDNEIAQAVADALGQTILNELELRP
ncbi:MAG TPA: hypothetical protein VLZ89_13340 [Anaerolineales bacterium]|nr:hypothetical protein [Anaerolineales bacterium]